MLTRALTLAETFAHVASHALVLLALLASISIFARIGLLIVAGALGAMTDDEA